jgi:ribosomal-protein-alanine N-acetyltransferase
VVGYAIAFAVGEDGELLNVAVEPERRGKGLAGQMVDALLIELAARGVRTAFLEVRESNRAARALYGSRGFTEIGRRNAYYRRPVEDALVMRRVLEVAEGDEERSAGTFADR